MGKKADEKTNVMRVLDQKKISYKSYCYAETGAVNGMEVAEILKENPDTVFKTLVTVGKTGSHYVFVVPVNRELDLKKAASRGKEHRNVEGKGFAASYRLCARRLFAHRNEKTV